MAASRNPDRRDRIWAHYSTQLLDQYREQYGPADSHHTDDATENPPLWIAPSNNPGASTAPLSSPAQAAPSVRGFAPPVTDGDDRLNGLYRDGQFADRAAVWLPKK
jgi:hypothetical protein